MKDRRASPENLADLYTTFPGLKDELQEIGLDPGDPEVGTAAVITAKVLVDNFAQRADKWIERIATLGPHLDETFQMIKEREAQNHSRLMWYQLLVSVAGFAAVSVTLIGNLGSFLQAARILADWFHKLLMSGLIDAAYAAPLGANDATAPILPVIIYGIYALLAIGYVGSFFAMIFAPDAKVRSNSFEYLKQITALFIGVASGKLV